MATIKSSKQPEKPTLYVGTGTPYIALFDEASQPILNPLTNLPLGLYMDSFRYTFQEANSRSSRGFRKNTNPGNEGKLIFRSEDPNTIDISGLQENSKIFIQYGYIFPDGSFLTSPILSTVIRQIDAVFDNNGVTALMRAAYGGYPSLVEKLLAYGADKDMTDKQGRVALDYVREHCRAQLEPILR